MFLSSASKVLALASRDLRIAYSSMQEMDNSKLTDCMFSQKNYRFELTVTDDQMTFEKWE